MIVAPACCLGRLHRLRVGAFRMVAGITPSVKVAGATQCSGHIPAAHRRHPLSFIARIVDRPRYPTAATLARVRFGLDIARIADAEGSVRRARLPEQRHLSVGVSRRLANVLRAAGPAITRRLGTGWCASETRAAGRQYVDRRSNAFAATATGSWSICSRDCQFFGSELLDRPTCPWVLSASIYLGGGQRRYADRCIYADAAGEPGALLGASEIQAVTSTSSGSGRASPSQLDQQPGQRWGDAERWRRLVGQVCTRPACPIPMAPAAPPATPAPYVFPSGPTRHEQQSRALAGRRRPEPEGGDDQRPGRPARCRADRQGRRRAYRPTSPLVLSDAQGLRCMVLKLTGTHHGGAYEVHCPTNRKIHVVWNGTAGDVTFKTVAGTGIPVNAGAVPILYCDVTNVIQLAGLVATINDIGDVVITAAASGLMLRFNGSSWVNEQPLRRGHVHSGHPWQRRPDGPGGAHPRGQLRRRLCRRARLCRERDRRDRARRPQEWLPIGTITFGIGASAGTFATAGGGAETFGWRGPPRDHQRGPGGCHASRSPRSPFSARGPDHDTTATQLSSTGPTEQFFGEVPRRSTRARWRTCRCRSIFRAPRPTTRSSRCTPRSTIRGLFDLIPMMEFLIRTLRHDRLDHDHAGVAVIVAAIFATIVPWWNLGLPRLVFSPELAASSADRGVARAIPTGHPAPGVRPRPWWRANPLVMLWPEMDAAFVTSGKHKQWLAGRDAAIGGHR